MTDGRNNLFFERFNFYDFGIIKEKYEEASEENSKFNLDIFQKASENIEKIEKYFQYMKEIITEFNPKYEQNKMFAYSLDEYDHAGRKRISLDILQYFNIDNKKDFHISFNWRKPPLANWEVVEIGINRGDPFCSEKIYQELFSQDIFSKNYNRRTNFLGTINLTLKNKQGLIDKLIEEIPKK